MLHAHRAFPHRLDGLLMQSSSFFTPALDPQEADFSGFAAVTEFVAEVHAASDDPHPVPAVLTCGTVEENLANNEVMAATLARLGYQVRLATVRDSARRRWSPTGTTDGRSSSSRPSRDAPGTSRTTAWSVRSPISSTADG
jgi:hypothetical protein